MSMKVGLTFACMNMKKLSNLLDFRDKEEKNSPKSPSTLVKILTFVQENLKCKKLLWI